MLLSFIIFVVLKVVGVKTNYTDYVLVNVQLSKLAVEVMEKYMSHERGCVTIISDVTKIDGFESIYNSVLRISYNSSNPEECDPELTTKLGLAFSTYCSNYIVQITSPQCFFPSWVDANFEFIGQKHNPRVLFLPVLPESAKYGEVVLNAKESDISANILIAEYIDDPYTKDWHVNIYTNNFFEPPNQPGRNGLIYLNEWHPKRGFTLKTNLFPEKCNDLRGKEVKVYAIQYPPYANNYPVEGTEVRIFKLFCELSNCTVITTTDDDQWGVIYHENKTGTGCTGMVYENQGDFCIGANYAWIEYWPHLDYSTAYLVGELNVIVPKPTLLGGWSTPFLPFPATLWLTIIGCILVSTVGLHQITTMTYKCAPTLRPQLDKNPKFISITDSFFRSIGMVVLQQPTQLVAGSPVRHLFTSLEIIYLVITTCYAAELYDYLTMPRTTKPIANSHDLADSGTIWLGIDEVWIIMIRQSDDPKLKKLVQNYRHYTDEQIVDLAEGGGYGIATEKLVGGHFVELPCMTDKFIDSSIAMKESYVQSPLFTFMRKGSPYLKRLNKIIGRILNAGLWYRWEDDCADKLLDYSKQQRLLMSTKKVTYPPKVLKVEDLEGAFVLYLGGMLGSLFLLVSEIVVHRRQKLHPKTY